MFDTSALISISISLSISISVQAPYVWGSRVAEIPFEESTLVPDLEKCNFNLDEMDSTKPVTALQLRHMLEGKYGRNSRIAVPVFDLKPSLEIPGTCDWFDASLLKFPTALAAQRKQYCKECWLVFNKEDDPEQLRQPAAFFPADYGKKWVICSESIPSLCPMFPYSM